MDIFNYSGDTGVSTGPDIARESPNDPGKFLTPAFATPDAPPANVQVGFAAVFLTLDGIAPSDYQQGTWQMVEDNRGLYYSTVDGSQVYLSELNVKPADRNMTSLVPGENTKWSGKKWVTDAEKIKAASNAEVQSQIAAIERDEQPAAQRKFVLEGDTSLMRAVQDKIDALTGQLRS